MIRNLIIPIKDKPKKNLIDIQTLREGSKSLLIVVPNYYAKTGTPQKEISISKFMKAPKRNILNGKLQYIFVNRKKNGTVN
jgi:hypothetical protein